MYRWTRNALSSRFAKLAVRVKCWNLPPVATHLACFLLGTLLFEPNSAGRVPPGILVPWVRTKVEGGVHATGEYTVISAAKRCLLFADSLKLWQAEEKKLFVLVGRSRLLSETLTALQKSDTRLALKNSTPLPHCEKNNVIIYP